MASDLAAQKLLEQQAAVTGGVATQQQGHAPEVADADVELIAGELLQLVTGDVPLLQIIQKGRIQNRLIKITDVVLQAAEQGPGLSPGIGGELQGRYRRFWPIQGPDLPLRQSGRKGGAKAESQSTQAGEDLHCA